MHKVGIFVHPRVRAAHELGRDLERFLRQRVEEVWLTTAWDSRALGLIEGTGLLVCIGGDGTMLWAARAVVPHRVPIMGVSMGRLAFLAEVRPEEARESIAMALQGKGRLEERAMLEARMGEDVYTGLNDVVVGRARLGRPVYVQVAIDGEPVALYRADAVVVASATGSTAYSLSAGGPVLHPEARELVLTPVSPHLATGRSLVLPPDAAVSLTVRGEHQAFLSVDGQEDLPLPPGSSVEVRRSPHVAIFLRLSPPQRDYQFLARRLGWQPADLDPDLPAETVSSLVEEDVAGP
ncbi:MAG TPA: NAD(+)/NADH kinase [Dehalococcoidia bacterium]|nr:NAD(+)/NADH kinase [Dehalococcoidia bacterium]